ncbi:hypothetical protein PFISCL1PPCAC_3097, partial [Pristionchus fissidentatus]
TLEDAFILAAGGKIGVNPGGQLPAGKHQLDKKNDPNSPLQPPSNASRTNNQAPDLVPESKTTEKTAQSGENSAK